jgi:NAD(P)-dependent dehydrogenase (short-subunit alcohol dehydrogenase family)
MRLRDRTVIVTGASSGIGRETARLFARAGANVVLASRNTEALARLAQELRPYRGRSLAVPTDVTDAEAVEGMVRRAAGEFGSVDILVNNAGISLYARLAEGSMENVRRLFDVNVFGALNCIRAVAPYMKQQRRGQIINVSSVAGKIAAPYEGAYAATKFALTAISDAVRLELFEYGIRVITVYPGPIDTALRENALKEIDLPAAPPAVRRIPPVRVAEAIVRAARDERPEVYVTWFDRAAVTLKGISPRFIDWGMRRFYLRRRGQRG